MAKARAEVRVRINRPVSEVFDYISNYNNNVNWQEGVVSSQQVTSGPAGVGTQVSYTRKLMGREVTATAQMTAFEKDQKIRMTNKSRLFTYDGGYDFSGDGAHTELVYAGVISSRIPGLGGQMVKLFQRQMENDLSSLKRLLEG